MNDERAPTATDVEEVFSCRQAKLATDVVELCRLRRVERLVAALEVGAGVHHLLTEPERVEVVADVVVKSHDTFVTLARVNPAESE